MTLRHKSLQIASLSRSALFFFYLHIPTYFWLHKPGQAPYTLVWIIVDSRICACRLVEMFGQVSTFVPSEIFQTFNFGNSNDTDTLLCMVVGTALWTWRSLKTGSNCLKWWFLIMILYCDHPDWRAIFEATKNLIGNFGVCQSSVKNAQKIVFCSTRSCS